MQPTERLSFQRLLTLIGSVYGKSLHEDEIDIWWDAFGALELKVIQAALKAHLVDPKTGRYMPTPADVVLQLSGTGLSKMDEVKGQAMDAWLLVMKVMREQGTKRQAFEDPLILDALQAIGGFGALGRSLEKDLPFLGTKFEQHYRRLRQKTLSATLPQPGEGAAPQIRLGREAQVGTFLKHLFNHRTEVNPHDRTVRTERSA